MLKPSELKSQIKELSWYDVLKNSMIRLLMIMRSLEEKKQVGHETIDVALQVAQRHFYIIKIIRSGGHFSRSYKLNMLTRSTDADSDV